MSRLAALSAVLRFGFIVALLLAAEADAPPLGASTPSSRQSAAAVISSNLGSDSATSGVVVANGEDWLATASESASNVANGINGRVKFSTYLWHGNEWQIQGSGILVNSSPEVTGVAEWKFSDIAGPVFAVSSEGGDAASISIIARVRGKWGVVPFSQNGTKEDGISPDSTLNGPTDGDEIVFQQCEETCSTVTFKYSKGQFESSSQPTEHSTGGTNSAVHLGKSWTLEGGDFLGSLGSSFSLSDVQIASNGAIYGLVTNTSNTDLELIRLAGLFYLQIRDTSFERVNLAGIPAADLSDCTKSSLIRGYMSCQASVLGFGTTLDNIPNDLGTVGPGDSKYVEMIGSDDWRFKGTLKPQYVGLAYSHNSATAKLLLKSFVSFMSQ